jgi:hypothetical protein
LVFLEFQFLIWYIITPNFFFDVFISIYRVRVLSKWAKKISELKVFYIFSNALFSSTVRLCRIILSEYLFRIASLIAGESFSNFILYFWKGSAFWIYFSTYWRNQPVIPRYRFNYDKKYRNFNLVIVSNFSWSVIKSNMFIFCFNSCIVEYPRNDLFGASRIFLVLNNSKI